MRTRLKRQRPSDQGSLGKLFLEGQAGERGLASDHTDAHLIAGYTELPSLEPDRGPDGRADARRLAALLQAPVLAGNATQDSMPVYHLAISAAKTDRLLTDAEWADIAAEYALQLVPNSLLRRQA